MDTYEEIKKPLFDHLNILFSQPHTNNFVVDIGCHDNSYFLRYGMNGIFFDLDMLILLTMAFPLHPTYKKIVKKITPHNVVNELSKYNTPKDFFALNLDISGYDLFVLIAILKEYQPKVIITGINEKIPFPIKFSLKYDPLYRFRSTYFIGYSINCLDAVLKHFGYSIYAVSYDDVILVKDKIDYNIETLYKTGYRDAPDRERLWGIDNNVEYWQTINDEVVLENEIKDFFKKNLNSTEGKYVIGKECEDIINKSLH
jgi:hypothetical protein